MSIKYKKAITIVSVILAIILIGLAYIFAFPMKKYDRISAETMKFEVTSYEEAEGFTDANLLSNTEKLVAENSSFKLFLDETTSHFYILDKITGEVIESNPKIEDPSGATGGIAERQKATLEYRYFNTNGTRSSRNNNYSKSIYHDKTPVHEEGYRTFKLKEIDNGFQVYYNMVDLDIDHLYFPKYLTAEQVEGIAGVYDHPAYTAVFELGYQDSPNSDGLYPARNYEGMTGIVIEELYKVFYEDNVFGDNYSREKAIDSNAKHGYFEETIKFSFEVAIQVTINDEGLEIKVINNSIKEYSESKLAEITLYPHFGTAIDVDPDTLVENKGYLVIPDGSGAIMNFNNGKTSARSYEKRLYGQDLAIMPYKMPEDQEDINIPLYGMVKEDIGFAAIISEGDAMATLHADISGKNKDSYNKIYPSFRVREFESAVIGGGWNTHEINVWSRKRAAFDYTIDYKILRDEENNYNGVARAYQKYLEDEKGLVAKDSLNKTKLTIELLGAYDHRKFFLGVPYNSIDTLTNFKQAQKIVDEIKDLGINDMDIIFNGIANGGLDNSLGNKVKFAKGLGGKKGYKKLESGLAEDSINIYPVANITTTNSYGRVFDKNLYSSKRVKGALSKVFEYHVPTRLPYEETQYRHRGDHFAISPIYYETILAKRNKSYLFTNVMFEGIGSRLTSNYIKENELYKHESLLIQERLLQNNNKQNMMINNPLGFAIPYLEAATNVPINTTIYSILDYEIPLMQLVMSGYNNYSGNSINLASSRDIDYQFLKVLETGSNLKYTLSYENSLKLLETDHNEYMSTEYINWLENIEKQMNILESSQIYEGKLEAHERLENNVFKSTYSNGVTVIVNYNITPVTIDGNTILANDYLIEGGK